jgi:hypothetical protein
VWRTGPDAGPRATGASARKRCLRRKFHANKTVSVETVRRVREWAATVSRDGVIGSAVVEVQVGVPGEQERRDTEQRGSRLDVAISTRHNCA